MAAKALRLSAPGLDATSGVTLGSHCSTHTLTGLPELESTLSAQHGIFTIDMSAASAALITFEG